MRHTKSRNNYHILLGGRRLDTTPAVPVRRQWRCTMTVKTVARSGEVRWRKTVWNVEMGYTGKTRTFAY